MNKYNVAMRSKPDMYEQYDATVAVVVENDDKAVDAAFRKLKQAAFPDRSRGMWQVISVTRIFT